MLNLTRLIIDNAGVVKIKKETTGCLIFEQSQRLYKVVELSGLTE